jgi:ribosomal protein S18 acetylase RimI-like enzyme
VNCDNWGDVVIRAARGEDSALAALLVYSAGPVAFEHIFNRVHGRYVVDFLQSEFAKNQTMFSHRHHFVYELDGKVVATIGQFDKPSHDATFLGTARAIWGGYGWRGIVKGLLFELRLVKAPKKHCFYLCNIAVDPAVRGQGIAAKLVNFMANQAKEAGYSRLSLDVAEQNHNALRLYQNLGFEVLQRHKSYNKVLDSHLYMEKQLVD